MTEPANNDLDKRRRFCKACIGGMTACSVGAVGFPVVSFLGFPRRVSAARPVEIQLDRLSVGHAQYVDFRGQQIIVLARDRGPLVVNAACTHLGCNVIWDTAESVFRCPCHGATFDDAGEVMTGPVNAPLKPIPFEVADGKIIVS
jgi:Rieske Fe-S protein